MTKPYYQDEYVTLYHGDNREIAPTLGSGFDLLLTDPPYGIGVSKKEFFGGGKWKNALTTYIVSLEDWDTRPSLQEIHEVQQLAHFHIIWGGNHLGYFPPSTCWLVWNKENGRSSFADCELAYTNLPIAVRMFSYTIKKEKNRRHPTQKPVPLMKWCISLAPQSATILDPFAGSGSTGVAAKMLRRSCVLIEQDETYCELAAKRLRETQPMMDIVVEMPITQGMPL